MQDLLSWINWIDAIGYAGGVVTLWGFSQRTMIPLRMGAIAGNVGFLAFGLLAPSYPTLVLHAVLLPMNTIRLFQSRKLIREIQTASTGDGTLNALIPFMIQQNHNAGDVLFNKGDVPDSMILISEGTVRLEEINTDCGPTDVLGEIAAFTPDNARTCTAVCITDVRLYRLANETMLQLFYQNPRFGMYLVRLIVHRLHGNWAEAEAARREQSRAL
jgi:CRP/FNR family transcriptional regulator, cyclic AMP receptor protein